MSTCFYLLC